jgi:hypothetical protein
LPLSNLNERAGETKGFGHAVFNRWENGVADVFQAGQRIDFLQQSPGRSVL